MVAPTASSSKAGAAFSNDQDFISFDFGDEASQDEQVDEPVAPSAAPQANGKKRKLDERNDDGLSKKERVRQAARATPWSIDVDWDRCWNAAEMLHRELIAFEQWLSPTREEHETRKMVIELIRGAITTQWRDAKVHSFGSQDTQLYMPQGDIDLVVICPSMEAQAKETILRQMAALLRRANLATDVQVIARAKVPIIKFVCTYGRYRIDVSINQANGLHAADWVCGWLRRCPALRPLIMAAKLLLSQRNMSEVFSGGLGSYSVICLVISHIQLHPKVQRGEIDPARNLGVLFLEFLELYGKNFGYDRVGISVRDRGRYFDKAARGFYDHNRAFMLTIEDPQDPTNDLARGSYSILNVRLAFGGAFEILTAAMCQRANELRGGIAPQAAAVHQRFDPDEEARRAIIDDAHGGRAQPKDQAKDPQSLLGHIFGISRDTVKARRDIEELYYSGTLQYKVGRPPPPRSPIPAPPPALAPPPLGPAPSLPPPPPAAGRAPKAVHTAPHKAPVEPKVLSIKGKAASTVSTSNGKAAPVASTSTGTTLSGSRSHPLVIVDDSSSAEEGELVRHPKPAQAAIRPPGSQLPFTISLSSDNSVVDEDELAESQGFSFSSKSGGSFENTSDPSAAAAKIADVADEEDSRYNKALGSQPRRKKKRKSESFIAEETDSSFSDSTSTKEASKRSEKRGGQKRRGRGGEPNGQPKSPAAAGPSSSQASKERRKQVADYWASKGPGSEE